MRPLEDDFLAGLCHCGRPFASPFTIATGTAAAPFLRGLVRRPWGLSRAAGAGHRRGKRLLRHTIDVAGLLTGQDISAQLRGRDLGDRVLIPIP